MDEKILGRVDDISEKGYDIVYQFNTRAVYARDNDNYDHHLFTAKSDDDAKNLETAKQMMKSMNWL